MAVLILDEKWLLLFIKKNIFYLSNTQQAIILDQWRHLELMVPHSCDRYVGWQQICFICERCNMSSKNKRSTRVVAYSSLKSNCGSNTVRLEWLEISVTSHLLSFRNDTMDNEPGTLKGCLIQRKATWQFFKNNFCSHDEKTHCVGLFAHDYQSLCTYAKIRWQAAAAVVNKPLKKG